MIFVHECADEKTFAEVIDVVQKNHPKSLCVSNVPPFGLFDQLPRPIDDMVVYVKTPYVDLHPLRCDTLTLRVHDASVLDSWVKCLPPQLTLLRILFEHGQYPTPVFKQAVLHQLPILASFHSNVPCKYFFDLCYFKPDVTAAYTDRDVELLVDISRLKQTAVIMHTHPKFSSDLAKQLLYFMHELPLRHVDVLELCMGKVMRGVNNTTAVVGQGII